MRLGRDGKVYYITARELKQEKVITREQLTQYSYLQEANKLVKVAIKLHQKALMPAYRRTLLRYKGKVILLEKVSPGSALRLIRTNLEYLRFLSRKLELLGDKKNLGATFEIYEKALRQYEVLCDQTEVLMEVTLDAGGYIPMITAVGDKVAFVKQGKEHLVPSDYMVYTDRELKQLGGDIPYLVHEAKKTAGAVVAPTKRRNG